MTKAERRALMNCADAIEADIDNGAAYIGQDPDTKEELTDKERERVEKAMLKISKRLRDRSGS